MISGNVKVIVIAKDEIQDYIFLSKCCELFPGNIEGIFIQSTGNSNKKSSNIQLKINKIDTGIEKQKFEKELRSLYRNISIMYWKYIDSHVFVVDDINSQSSTRSLHNICPDLILSFGVKIHQDDWMNIPRLGAVNMHTGIFPYYNNSFSTQWALYQENYYNIGITIYYTDQNDKEVKIISEHLVDPFQNISLIRLKAKVLKSGIDRLLETGFQIINNSSRIRYKAEKFIVDCYPKQINTMFCEKVATLRMKLINQYEWPFIPNYYEKISFKFSTKIVNKILNKSMYFNYHRKQLQNGVYIFLYHSIVDLSCCSNWERASKKVMTEKANFNNHINFLYDHAINIKLSEVTELFKKGNIDKPYFVITFDDGLKNISTNALPLCSHKKINPTVFINANFVEKPYVYYRVLCALLISEGYEHKIIKAFEKLLNIKLSSNTDMLSFTKNNYQYQTTEKAIYSVWNEVKDKDNNINNKLVHLQWEDLLILQKNGWEIGNHTLSHPILSKLTYVQQKNEIETNVVRMNDNGIKCIKWLSYPYGSVKHVDNNTYRWLCENDDWNGIFASGGINIFPSRTEWLRIGIGNDDIKTFIKKISINEYIMKKILHQHNNCSN